MPKHTKAYIQVNLKMVKPPVFGLLVRFLEDWAKVRF